MSDTPHASWAEVYDLVYEKSFGSFYSELTRQTLTLIENRFSTDLSILDFGAGTGRISLPLAQAGYPVTAVDSCQEMIEQLKRKDSANQVNTIVSTMEDFQAEDTFDLVLCVFTVLIYLLDESQLEKAVDSAFKSCKSGGYMLMDIPSRGIFSGNHFENDGVKRKIKVEEIKNGLYQYDELIKIENGAGEEMIYQDSFPIRYWDPDKVLHLLEEKDFKMEEELSGHFAGSGSNYFLFCKDVEGKI